MHMNLYGAQQGIGIEYVDLEWLWNILFSGTNGSLFSSVSQRHGMELDGNKSL